MLSSRTTNRLSDLRNIELHEECRLFSKEPAIIIIEGLDGKRNTLAAVWYDSGHRDQFEFHLTVSLRKFEDKFATHPEVGTVVFLGQVKDWPNEEARGQIVNDLHLPSDEAYVVHWIVPIGMRLSEKGEPLPVSCICEVFLIGHSELGLLRPEKYYSKTAEDRAMKKFYQMIGWSALASPFRSMEVCDDWR